MFSKLDNKYVEMKPVIARKPSRLPCVDTELSHIVRGERTLKPMAAIMSVTALIVWLSRQRCVDSWAGTPGCWLLDICAIHRLKALLNGESHSVGDRGAICLALCNTNSSSTPATLVD